MSIPPVNYNVPPPQLNIPPPGLSSMAPPVPPPNLYQQPTLYTSSIACSMQPPPSVSLPPLNIPPPPVSTYPPANNLQLPPYPPPNMPTDYMDYSYYAAHTTVPTQNEYETWMWDKTAKPVDGIDNFGKNNWENPIITKLKNEKSGCRSYSKDISSKSSKSSSSSKDKRYVIDKRDSYETQHGHQSSRSLSSSSGRYSRSPSRQKHREKDRDSYYSQRRHDYERRGSPHYRDYRSHSRSYDSHDSRHYRRSPDRWSQYSSKTVSSSSRVRDPSPRSRRDPSPRSRRDPSPRSRRDPSPRSRRDLSPRSRRDPSPRSRRDLTPRSLRETSPRSRHEQAHRKPKTDREKILEEYSKNFCKTPEDYIEKMRQWSEQNEAEAPKVWYRSSPAELYYKSLDNGNIVEQTVKLEKLCDKFFKELIERGRNARPEVDELPPLKPPKVKMCKHKLDESFDEDGLEYTDRIMLELQRKQSHPRRLHPEMWYNNTGEMNGGSLCRCSAKARRHGMRHGIYAGEEKFPRCIPTHNNIDKLYHYQITVSPPTNFLIKAPTMINHDEHEFLFAGFSLFSHYKLAELPTCKVIRFNIEYTILYVEESTPKNFTIRELDLFEDYLFYELLELIDLDLGKPPDESSCSQFHFMPRFVRALPEGGCEVLSMCEVVKYLVNNSGLLIPPDMLEEIHKMDHYNWQTFVDKIKGSIVTCPGKKPCSVRVDQLDRSPPTTKDKEENKKFYPEIVHFGIRPPQLSYAGNPEYQKARRYYVKYRHLIANMAKPSVKERQKLASKEAKLQEMRTQSKMKRDVTVAISSEGFYTTGLMCDVVQHAMLIPVLVRHLRFHKSLDSLEKKIGYVFKQRALLQTALTHPSYRENFGTNPDHARNSLTNCGIRQPQYGDRRIHYTRKKGIVTLINIMSRPGKNNETESEIKHNERLEFLGDAVVEFLSSIHLFKMFPGLAEGGLATYRAAIVQNQHLAQLAKNIGLEQFMLYAHGSDLCRDVVMRHAMANCFEALMGALFLDAKLEVADRVFALALWHNDSELLQVWTKDRAHPLQEQEPLGDRKYIKDFEFLQKLTEFEESIGIQFKHIRVLARSFTDRSVGFTHLTLGSNQRLEFLGDTVLQLLVSDRLYRHFPDHHEGHLSLLRSSLVNNRTQALVCDDLNMSAYAIYNNPKAKPTTKKHKADLLEAFLGALYIDKNLEYCQTFCNACFFPRLQEFILNQDWNDPKSKLQQCCLTLRSIEGGEPDIPFYKVIECLGPTNTRVYTVGVYFRGTRLAAARGHSIQEAEMNAAKKALSCAHELFPQLDHQKRVIAKSMKKKRRRYENRISLCPEKEMRKRKCLDDNVPKAYRLDKHESSDESSAPAISDEEPQIEDRSDEDDEEDDDDDDDDSGLVSDTESLDKLNNVQVSSLVSDMEKIKEDFIKNNQYEKLKEKCRRSDSDIE